MWNSYFRAAETRTTADAHINPLDRREASVAVTVQTSPASTSTEFQSSDAVETAWLGIRSILEVGRAGDRTSPCDTWHSRR